MEWVDSRADLEPRNDEEKLMFAEEEFRISTQIAIHALLEKLGLSQKDLAKRLNVSPARVSQIFSDECNLTLRKVARIFFVLGATPTVEVLETKEPERKRKPLDLVTGSSVSWEKVYEEKAALPLAGLHRRGGGAWCKFSRSTGKLPFTGSFVPVPLKPLPDAGNDNLLPPPFASVPTITFWDDCSSDGLEEDDDPCPLQEDQMVAVA